MTMHGTPPTARTNLFARLAAGEAVTDQEVDAQLPHWAEELSRVHWTPVAVARCAAAFLTERRRENTHILDVGSGAGKFCVVAAASTGARCTGIERNARLADVARAFAVSAGVDGVEVLQAEMDGVDWTPFHAIYFYNPFVELFISDGIREQDERSGWPTYVHYVRTALAKLYLMPEGTRVATYHGIGATMPPGYKFVGGERFGEGLLRFYVRVDPLTLRAPAEAEAFFDYPGIFEEPTEDMAPLRLVRRTAAFGSALAAGATRELSENARPA